jgi:regulator of protease activity HflC (stomatin/prohibitin superfamily)
MKKITLNSIICLVLSAILFSCAPPKIEVVEEIKNDETAYVIPFEGASKESQRKFMSVDYLNENKVAAKRIIIPQRSQSIGRFWFNIKWIPTINLIKVKRSPVTREWTSEKNTGSNQKDDSIPVESKDSIGFKVGINLTTMIKEEDTTKFLHFFSGKTLTEITDENVRGSVASILSREFGSRDLKDCKTAKKEIQAILETEINEKYTQYGITVSNVGLVGGLEYENPEIQTAINNAYIAEMKVSEAIQARLEQDQINLKNIAKAEADRKAAEEFAKAQEAQIKKIQMEVELNKSLALLKAADKWKGDMPSNILPSGSNLLFGLDKKE